jgi:hypothetical protein
MLREELQSYFDRVYPHSKIDTEHTLGGKIYIQFELGEGQNIGTMERVYQSADRALMVFNDAFPEPSNEIFILIYEYKEPNVFSASNDYLRQQFPKADFAKFYNQKEVVNTSYFTTDENGDTVPEKDEVRVIIGKLPVKGINVKNILMGIANTEMGFDPGIDQRVYFFNPSTDRAFQMYDDRGCCVWSNKADNLRELYVNRNDWIVEHHRQEIENAFK